MGHKYKAGDLVIIRKDTPLKKLDQKFKETFEKFTEPVFIERVENHFVSNAFNGKEFAGNYCYLVSVGGNEYRMRSQDLEKVTQLRKGYTVKFFKDCKPFVKGDVTEVLSVHKEKNSEQYRFKKGKQEILLSNEAFSKFAEVELFNSIVKVQLDKTLFDTIVLPDDHLEAVNEAISQTRKAVFDKLFNEWGFGAILEKGRGSHLLFFGAPGTGKTLMGQAIAQKLKRDLRVVQAAEIESSEPGGAERAIKAFFQEATKKNLVLLFDECDSLIYDRSQVGMILASQINTLLSEMEKFDGVCIYTTNNTPVLDKAFERRLSLKLEFPMPDKEARLAIWKRMFVNPECLHDSVNLEEFAKYRISGGTIKNIVLNAARRAAYKGKAKIEKEDINIALERERDGAEAFSKKSNRPRLIQGGYDVGMGSSIDIKKEKDEKNGTN